MGLYECRTANEGMKPPKPESRNSSNLLNVQSSPFLGQTYLKVIKDEGAEQEEEKSKHSLSSKSEERTKKKSSNEKVTNGC